MNDYEDPITFKDALLTLSSLLWLIAAGFLAWMTGSGVWTFVHAHASPFLALVGAFLTGLIVFFAVFVFLSQLTDFLVGVFGSGERRMP